ncbi:glycosyltransferase [Candidatus Peregrinibacteria bacterium]|nr:MAG: glycosyltransferase [Candidatus Peregrinibacteria bacterium]
MNVALVHEMLIKLGGAERVVKTWTDMFPDAPIFTLFNDPEKSKEWFEGKKIHTSILQKNYETFKRPKYLLPKMPKAIEALQLNQYDLVLSSSSAFAHGIKPGKHTKHICYVHSPMRYAWDYTHQTLKNYSWPMQWLVGRMLTQLRVWDFYASDRADVLVANSQHVQKRIHHYWKKPSELIYPPVNIKRFTPRKDHADYFLIVSTLSPFKRIDLAVELFNKIKRKLVIIGDGTHMDYLKTIAKPNIEFLGRQSDENIKEYMEYCRALIFPGEEDFGITPVEAMAAGKPVLAYAKGGVTESVQAGLSGEFFDHPNIESIENGLTRLLMNESSYQPQKIRQLVEHFDEAVFKEKIDQLVKKTLNN